MARAKKTVNDNVNLPSDDAGPASPDQEKSQGLTKDDLEKKIDELNEKKVRNRPLYRNPNTDHPDTLNTDPQ